MNEKWYVYFISCGNKANKFVKIGIAKDPAKRILGLQIGNPYDLKLTSSIECRSRRHALNLERWLHGCFFKYHVRGEWFKEKYLNIPRALAGFETDVELSNQKGKGIHGTKAQQKIAMLNGKNIALEKSNKRLNDAIDQELDRETLFSMSHYG